MKTAKKLITALLICTAMVLSLAAISPASAATVSEVLETTYALDQILFGSEEVNGFTFVYYDKADSQIKPMVYLGMGESPWNQGLDMYTGPTEEGECEGYEYIIFNYTYGCPTVHPSLMGNTGCAFTAPYTGTIKVMTYFRVGSALPDASEVQIYKNSVSDETCLLKQVGTEDGATAEYTVEVEVTAGDIIYWFVDCVETTANDSCDFNPRVQYTAVNDENVSADPETSETDPPASSDADTEDTEDTEDTSDAPASSDEESKKDSSDNGASTTKAPDTGSSGSEDGGSNAWIWIVVAAVVVVAVVVAVVLIKKKK